MENNANILDNVKKVLAFDVGIINLAFCILHIDMSTERFKIIKWGLINLASDRKRCTYIKRGGDICDKIANTCTNINNTQVYLCPVHSKKNNDLIIIDDFDVEWINNDKITKCSICDKNNGNITIRSSNNIINETLNGTYCKVHIKMISKNNKIMCNMKKCEKLITKAIINEQHNIEIGWCNDHYVEQSNVYIKKKTKNMKQNANKAPLINLACSMFSQLDNLSELLMVDEVYIENQPTLINPTMKSISSMLYSYFIMKGIYEKNKTNSTITNVAFCSPSNKLNKIKIGGLTVDEIIKLIKEKLKSIDNSNKKIIYDITKQLGKEYCKAFISDNPDYLNIIEQCDKQDDMADAFLHAFTITFGKNIPQYYYDLLQKVNINELITKYLNKKNKKNNINGTIDTNNNNELVNKILNIHNDNNEKYLTEKQHFIEQSNRLNDNSDVKNRISTNTINKIKINKKKLTNKKEIVNVKYDNNKENENEKFDSLQITIGSHKIK